MRSRAPGPMSHHHACDSRCKTSAREHDENENNKKPPPRHSWNGDHLNDGPSPFCASGVRPRNLQLRSLLLLAVLLVTWASLCGQASAHNAGDQQRSATVLDPVWTGPSLLVLDTRPPPAIAVPLMQRRQEDEKDEKKASTTTASAARSTTSIATDPKATDADFAVPKAFDTALSNNFTASCANFFRAFLANDAFTLCHPFSLLLQTSSGLFDASKSYIRITQTLEATCSVNFQTCLGNMGHLAREIIAESNCGADYANDNPQVLQAYNGLVAYEPLYQASCLRDDAGSYCYANAVTNRTATTDPYPYYLPLGVPLPGGTRPTCNSCLQDVMAIYSSFAGNLTQPISKTYNDAAQQIGIVCGTGFVNQTATPLKAAAPTTSVSVTPILSLLIMLLLCFFQ